MTSEKPNLDEFAPPSYSPQMAGIHQQQPMMQQQQQPLMQQPSAVASPTINANSNLQNNMPITINTTTNQVGGGGSGTDGRDLQMWSSGICGCFDNIPGCLAASCCCPCYMCYTLCQMEEALSGVLCFCVPGITWYPVLLAARAAFRSRSKIHGSVCDDVILVTCCPLCSLCQLGSETVFRRAKAMAKY